MDLSGKSVAVYGLGVSGLGALQFLRGKSLKSLVVVNRGAPATWRDQISGIEDPVTALEEGSRAAIEALGKVDLILLAPGISRSSVTLAAAHTKNIPIWNELELAGHYFFGPMIALTGTNGKTTSVSFLAQVLRELGLNPFVGGNIGRSFLEGLTTKENFDVALLEVSSFQCESLRSLRATVAGILNLFVNHGERYDSIEDYRQAKWLLARPQQRGDYFFVGPDCGAPPFPLNSTLQEITLKEADKLSKVFDLSELKVVGLHNRFNLWFCWQMIQAFCAKEGISNPQGRKSAFQRALNDFKGVEHRIEYSGENESYIFYNDAKSTNWQATLSAIKALKESGHRDITVLIGGQLRSPDDNFSAELRSYLKGKPEIDVFLYGESRYLLEKKLRAELPFRSFKDLKNIFEYLRKNSEKTSGKKKVVLLSPAFPSFDQFENYSHRGAFFKEKVRELL